MEMQQMMEFSRKQLRDDREYFMARIEANRKKDKEEMEADTKAWREKVAAEKEAIKARTRAIRENMGTSHKEMVAVIEHGRDMETIACQEMGGTSRRGTAGLSGHET
jgi:sRNA-binding protein